MFNCVNIFQVLLDKRTLLQRRPVTVAIILKYLTVKVYSNGTERLRIGVFLRRG